MSLLCYPAGYADGGFDELFGVGVLGFDLEYALRRQPQYDLEARFTLRCGPNA